MQPLVAPFTFDFGLKTVHPVVHALVVLLGGGLVYLSLVKHQASKRLAVVTSSRIDDGEAALDLDDEKPSGSEWELSRPELEPLNAFDHAAVSAAALRPYKPKFHLTMGMFCPCFLWLAMADE